MIPFIFIDSELYIDFRTLTQISPLSRSTLYRRLINSVPRTKLGNKKLIKYKDVLQHPVLSKLIDKNGETNDI